MVERRRRRRWKSAEARASRFHGLRALIALGVAGVTYLAVPGLAGGRLAAARGRLGGAGQRHRAVRVHASPRSPRSWRRSRTTSLAAVEPIFSVVPAALDSSRALIDELRGRARGASRRAADDAERHRGIQQLAAAARRSAHGRRRRCISRVPGARRRRDRRRAARRTTAGSRAALPPRACSTRCRAPSRCGGTAPNGRVNADSVPTFATLLVAARAAPPGPAHRSRATRTFRKLLTAFFRPTHRLRPRRDGACAAGAPPVGADDKYTLQLGEKIVGAHEVVGREEHEKMRALQDELARRGGRDAATRAASSARCCSTRSCSRSSGSRCCCSGPQLYASMRAVLLFAIVFLHRASSASSRHRAPAAARAPGADPGRVRGCDRAASCSTRASA